MCTKTKIFRYILAAAYIVLAVWAVFSAITICRDGMAVRKTEDVLAAVYTGEIVAKHLAPMVPLFFVTVGMTVAVMFLENTGAGSAASCKRAGKKQVPEKCEGFPEPSKNSRLIRTIILIAALCMILAGVMNGGARDVLIKAVNLCTECVGLG